MFIQCSFHAYYSYIQYSTVAVTKILAKVLKLAIQTYHGCGELFLVQMVLKNIALKMNIIYSSFSIFSTGMNKKYAVPE